MTRRRTSLTVAVLGAMAAVMACSEPAGRVRAVPAASGPGLTIRETRLAVAVPAMPLMPLATPLVRPRDTISGSPGTALAGGQAPPPVRVAIPAIGVDAGLGQVGLRPDGTIAVPSDWNQPAWFTAGPAPGAQGPAVIVGHLDSDTGPAVFWRLAQIRPGDLIEVTRSDGSTASFRVNRVGDFGRDRFPTTDVYGPTPAPTLRLITCAGTFDWSTHRYSDNVVVFADLA